MMRSGVSVAWVYRLALSCVLLLHVFSAGAAVPDVTEYRVVEYLNFQPGWAATEDATCRQFRGHVQTETTSGLTFVWTVTSTVVTPAGACRVTWNRTLNGGSPEAGGADLPIQQRTGPGPSPGSELEEFCGSHKKNTFNQKGTIGSSSPTPQSSCYKPYPPFEGADAAKGCEMTLRDMVKAPGEDGLMNWSGSGTPTGATCEDAAATDEKPKAEDDKCVGGFSGTVNGVQKCIPAEPDKGIEGVKTGTVTDSDGTKHEIKEETKCEGIQCTTTTTTKTTTTSGTTTTTTKSETQSLTDKCAKDPSNKVCTKTNGGTGSSGSPTGCAANSSGAGCGGAGAGIGGLYEGKDATVQGIMDKAVADLKGSGIGGAVGSFFTVPGGGSAPSMVWNIPYFNVTVSPPGLNSEVAMAIYPVLKGVLLLVAGFVAFRIAIDN